MTALLWIWFGGYLGAITAVVVEEDQWPEGWIEWLIPLIWPLALARQVYLEAKERYDDRR